ncbi:hypothetical protein ACP70R_009468 [Stipagrostis hirtigluma subsp. patula]
MVVEAAMAVGSARCARSIKHRHGLLDRAGLSVHVEQGVAEDAVSSVVSPRPPAYVGLHPPTNVEFPGRMPRTRPGERLRAASPGTEPAPRRARRCGREPRS